jgi:hypothetical protein
MVGHKNIAMYHHKKHGKKFGNLELWGLQLHNNQRIWQHKEDHLDPIHSTFNKHA